MNKETKYLIIGNGRLAKHLKFLFTELDVPFYSWDRTHHNTQALPDLHQKTLLTLLCISDSQIANFILENKLTPKKCVHFSGALHIPETLQYHPLMTFAESLYPKDFYFQIPYVGIHGQPPLSENFPFLTNPYYEISPEQKPLYHALCVMAGNFTQILWIKALKEFSNLGIPEKDIAPYMTQIFQNLKGQSPLTGPLVRRDLSTLKNNLKSLEGDAFFDIYTSFVKTYDPTLYKELQL